MFPNSSAGKYSCHLMTKRSIKHIQCRHFHENWNCKGDVLYMGKYEMSQLYITYLCHKWRCQQVQECTR
jgi:hypothetical protein